MIRVEHIGIAVKSLKDSVPLYEKLLNSTCYKQETVKTENVNTAFFKMGESKIELLEVEDIEAEMTRLVREGFILLNDTPREGADNKLICFLHPKNTSGVLIELCMEKK